MAKKLQLTWRPDGRWQKFYGGKRYYFRFAKGEYRAALEAWRKQKEIIDAAAEPVKIKPSEPFDLSANYAGELAALAELKAMHLEAGRLDRAELVDARIGEIERGIEVGSLPPLPVVQSPLVESMFQSVPDLAESFDESIGGAIRDFLNSKRPRVSEGRWENVRGLLSQFEDFAGRDRPAKSINAKLLEDYHGRLLKLMKRIDGKRFSKSRADDALQVVKDLTRWLWEHERISLPRNLKKLTISRGAGKVEPISDKDLKTLLGAASESTKLYCLLMLQCGMTQIDIADLKHSEVDWKSGRIIRKRSKTGDHEHVPTVDYKLWGETFRLLKKFKSKHNELVLTNENGEPLKIDGRRGDRYFKNDNIASAFNRLRAKMGVQATPKQLRKAAATKLASHPEHSRYVPHFLGHSPRTIADKHYVKPSRPQFDKAIKWLAEQYGY